MKGTFSVTNQRFSNQINILKTLVFELKIYAKKLTRVKYEELNCVY